MSDLDRTTEAFDAAVNAIASAHLTATQRDATPEEFQQYADGLRQALLKDPDQFQTHDEWCGEASLPVSVVAEILASMLRLSNRVRYLSQYEKWSAEKDEQLWSADQAWNNPRENNRAKYSKDALAAIGLTTRRKMDYGFIAEEFEDLVAAGNGAQQAYDALASKYNVTPDAIRNGLKRRREK